MLTALLWSVPLALAVVCGAAVYRSGDTQPLFRAVLTAAILVATPVVVFWLVAAGVTGALPMVVVAVPVVLLGAGLYIIAEGTVPRPFRSHERTR